VLYNSHNSDERRERALGWGGVTRHLAEEMQAAAAAQARDACAIVGLPIESVLIPPRCELVGELVGL